MKAIVLAMLMTSVSVSVSALAANPYRLLCGSGLGGPADFRDNPSLDVQKSDSEVSIHVWGQAGENLWFLSDFLKAAGHPGTFIDPQSRFELKVTVPFSFDNNQGTVEWSYSTGPILESPSLSARNDYGKHVGPSVPVSVTLSGSRGENPTTYTATLRFADFSFEYDELKRYIGHDNQALEEHRNAELDFGGVGELKWGDIGQVCEEHW